MCSRPSSDQTPHVRTSAPAAASVDVDRQPPAELETLVRERTAQLAEAHRQTTAALDSINEGFVILDRDGRFAFVNAAAERLIQKPRGELLGKSQWDVYPEASHRQFGVELTRAVTENVPVHFEEFYPEPLNRWFEVRAYPSAEGLSIFFSDVTEHRRREAELRAALTKYAVLFESFPLGITVADAQGNIVETNDAAVRLLGVPKETHARRPVGGTDWRLIRPDGTPMPTEEFAGVRALQEQRRIDNVEMGVVRGDGGVTWLSVTAAPLPLAGHGVVVTYGDITDLVSGRRELEQARSEAVTDRGRLEAVMDALPIGVAIIDAHGGNTRSNAAFEAIWSGPRPATMAVEDYAAYKAWWTDTDRPVEPGEWASARAVRSGETVVGQVMRIERFDGTRGFVLNSAAPVFDAVGAIVGSAVAIQDITERVASDHALAASEAALQRANEQLRAANEELRFRNETLEERVTARTADLMHRTTQLQALAGELARAEEHERRRVAQVIHDHLQQLLVGARMNLGIVGGQTRNANIRKDLKQVDDVIGEALETARTLTAELSPAVLYRSGLPAALSWLGRWYHEKHAITVQVEADQDVAVQPEEIRITLYRCVSELLFNVVKHAHTKIAGVRLGTTADGRTQIVVSDSGVGFDPQDARAREGSGGGFGLLNIRERLESLGGKLEVASEPGCGTRVTVIGPRLAPACPDTPPSEPASPPARRRRKSAAGRRAIRLLLVDDHAVVRDGLIRALRNDPSLEVVGQAADGREALEAARRLRPDVILMDVAMPGMDGIEATRAVRIELPDVKVIGLSMFDEETYGAKMRSAGAVGFVHKTAPTAAIVRAIREHAGMPPRPARERRAPTRT